MCGWNECTLDVHHIEGNRNTNNDTENLVYLCPNCHRKHHSGMIASDELILNRENYKLSQSEDIEWATFLGVDSVGEKETYDLEMRSPYNNYIANDFVVHNCGDAIVKGKSLTNHYIDRKSGKDVVDYQFEVLEPILKSTYGILVYQEQAMQIAQLVAGFSLGQADNLRKAIGKKNVELMAKVKQEFIEGSQELKMINKEEAEEIFSWIEKSQKYSFNKSHSVSYAINAYQTAYCKAHFPRAFFTSYLRHAKGKPKPLLEVNDLVSNARSMDIDVMPPNIMQMKKEFCLVENTPTFGITNIKNVGESVFDQLEGYIKENNIDIYGMTWEEFLMRLGRFIKSNSFESMIEAGAFDCYKMQRSKMIYHFNIYKEIKDRDKTFLSNDKSKTFIKGIENCIDDIVKNRRRTAWTDKNIEFLRSCIISLKEPPYELIDRPSWRAKKERDLMGIELTCSEVDEYDTMDANCTCREYLKGFDSNSIAIAAQVEDIREWKTKNGKHKGSVMAFLRLSDGTCTLDSTTIFSDDWKRMKETVSIGKVLLFRGTKDEKFGSFIIKKVQKLKQCI
jgi:DNA polymerase III alpha subunit